METNSDDFRDPLEIINFEIEGILEDITQVKGNAIEGSSGYFANENLIYFAWKRVSQGLGRGLYLENICFGAREVKVEWRRNGRPVEDVEYRIPGRSRRRVRERTKEGYLISETPQFDCSQANMDATCKKGADALHGVEFRAVSPGGAEKLITARNKSREYVFFAFEGKLSIVVGDPPVPYRGVGLLTPREKVNVMQLNGSDDTFQPTLARYEPK